eukprot:Mycagemm_TRINITY_DN10371_c0_g10::TRINITY_DN10371_c0_g10_i2::g.470::m.470 type:complete len:108 gc:universal TRINITY_DN10371_c0_g10_i2:351-28(-)
MLRGIQPTIRLAVSDFQGIWQVTVCRAAQTLGPGTYACRGSSDTWNPGGLSGGVMAPLLCPLRPLSSEAQIAKTCGVSQAASGRRGHRKTAGFVDPYSALILSLIHI